MAGPAPSLSGGPTPRLPAGQRGHLSEGNCGGCGWVSELRLPRLPEPRPAWGELPKPRLQAPQPLPPPLSPASGALSP